MSTTSLLGPLEKMKDAETPLNILLFERTPAVRRCYDSKNKLIVWLVSKWQRNKCLFEKLQRKKSFSLINRVLQGFCIYLSFE